MSFGDKHMDQALDRWLTTPPEDNQPDASERSEGRKRFLHMMFTTALEGGIGYWSVADEYHWLEPGTPEHGYNSQAEYDDIDGFYAILESNEEDWGVEMAYVSEVGEVRPITETQSLRVDLDVMERGMNLFVDKVIEATKSEDPDAPFSRRYLRQGVSAWLMDGEEGDFDSSVADLVVQLGLFGTVVYA